MIHFHLEGDEVFPKMTQMGRLRPLDRPFPGFSFFQRVTESVGLIFKSRFKRGTNFFVESVRKGCLFHSCKSE